MSDQTNGLRFDLYERIHLPDDVAAIDELEEIELVPRIQVIDQGDQAVLKGQLLLSGIYRGQNAVDGTLTLEHWIPVEISLPMSRVSRLDDITIEIDNFDVDLLSARTLNITGVLSLKGVSVETDQEAEAGLPEEEAFTAVHQREQTSDAESWNAGAAFGEAEDEELRTDEEQESDEEQQTNELYIEEEEGVREGRDTGQAGDAEQPDQESWLQWESEHASPSAGQSAYPTYATQERQERPGEHEEQIEEQQNVWQSRESASASAFAEPADEQHAAEAVLAGQQEGVTEVISEPLQEDRGTQGEKQAGPDVQIAFSGKTAGDLTDSETGFGFRALLQSSKREAAREAAEQQAVIGRQEGENARNPVVEEEVEWKNLFLASKGENHEFRKIRVCIVQREETLEQIALRYQLNPRELLVHNGLHESSVEEGQLLYIP